MFTKIYDRWLNLNARKRHSISAAASIFAFLSALVGIAGVSLDSMYSSTPWYVRLLAICILFILVTVAIYYMLGKLFKDNIKLQVRGIPITIKSGDIFTQKGLKIIPFNEHYDTLLDGKTITRNTLNGIFLEKYIDRTRLKGLQNYQREKLKQLSDHRVLLLGMYCRLAEYGMAIEDLPENSKVVAAYLETIENGYTEKEAVRMREMLAVLCTLGTFEPLTMEALSTLYREDGISLHLIGMLRDLAPILKVERSADGNGYRIANPELAKELAAQIPETEDEVRRIVNLSMSILTDGLVKTKNVSDIGLLFTEAFGSVKADDVFILKPDTLKKEPGMDIIAAHVAELAQQYLPEGMAAVGRGAYNALLALTGSLILFKNPQDVKRMQDYHKQWYCYCKDVFSENDLATAKAKEKYGNECCGSNEGVYVEEVELNEED